ncbi:MAG: glycogen debranching protein GlgX [Candidatus Omnitrophica bacterium]|nr:glycogen debranching protein GlgX [Candidatus Omnitrophota bacterium]MDE2010153.1 glycogen debranching protein GlgX [Candidatus Omnitrophota bacterium]MDE2214886.1 glycogen debranching protein GlgX [Candidatus Omnitrophota bacterium]MDE2230783.1 glycogen debranching protein GlgX [Candidatus Omnitrophota bacterium]
MKKSKTISMDVQAGSPSPLGAYVRGEGVNFAIFSKHAAHVRLELFDSPEAPRAFCSIDLDPVQNRTGDVWHILVKGLRPGQLYAYRMDGPYDPSAGHRFNHNKLLLDPYARAVTRIPNWDFDPALGYDPSAPYGNVPSTLDDAGAMPKCVVTQDDFDWQGDCAPRHPWGQTVIYETHVRGFTVHPSSGVKCPGTYRGLIEKVPYLKELGVTTVELLPVHEFNEAQVTSSLGKSLKNYWGYDPIVFLAPKASYSSLAQRGGQIREFKEMILSLHQAGIEVVLDVVFNHTGETDLLGSTLCFRGIDNSVFYMLEDDKRIYKNFTGTGNTFNANHPLVQEYILDALRYWVQEMHVDGFRFDLASILNRDTNGNLLNNAPVLDRIAKDEVLKDVKLIAEPWDAVGAYQVGNFSRAAWAEWNDRYRNEVRLFWRGDDGMLGAFAGRICGSADVFAAAGKGPHNSINFITCHDGFTMNDLVSYNDKHNEANKQNNRDGANENFSYNYGVEGRTTDAAVEAVRNRQIKNFLLTLFVSRGVPMLLGGDEFRRTQGGNNNVYCQDNELSWYNWSFFKANREIYNFTRGMIALRRDHPVLSRGQFYTDADVQWFSPQGGLPDWANRGEKRLACLIHEDGGRMLFLMFNAGFCPVDFRLPPVPSGINWYQAVDTSLPAPRDLYPAGKGPRLDHVQTYHLNQRSGAILLAAPNNKN